MIAPKIIKNADLGYSSIKAMVRRGQGPQPLKILFENQGDMPVDVDFQVDKSGPEINVMLM